MSDIVERLREGVWGRARRADAVIQANMQEGADEIERLRAEVEAARREEREANALYCAHRQRAYEVRAADADMTVRHYTSADIAGTFAAAFESAAGAIRARGDA
jgi:hypothetical protein